jgi:DNA-binding NtrC family response regulator
MTPNEIPGETRTENQTPGPPAAPRRILIVEDLDDSRESLQELLEVALQVEVDAAEDGVRALEMLAVRPYHLVLTDLRMPRANGMRLLREVRERELKCPVVVVTGHGNVKDAVEAMKLGAHDFLTKPLDPQELILFVDRILRETAGGAK